MSLGNAEHGVSDPVAHIHYLHLILIQKVRVPRQHLKQKVFVATFGHEVQWSMHFRRGFGSH